MTPSQLMQALSEAGAPFEAILIAVQALEAKDAEIAARDAEAAQKRARDAERKREERANAKATSSIRNKDASTDSPRTVHAASDDPPNDIYSNPPVPPSLANANDAPPSFSDRFVEAWNAERGLRPARKLAGQRLTKLRKRQKEFGEETLFEAVRKLGASPFHCGKNDREWQADIGWLIRSDDNVTKALELPDPGGKIVAPVDALATAESAAALYRRMGRDEDAAEAEKRAARLRDKSTGPPRPIGRILQSVSPHPGALP